jgi:hypothetical protein
MSPTAISYVSRLHAITANTMFLNFFSTLRLSIDVDYYQALHTKPHNRGQILFGRSLKYYVPGRNSNKIVTLAVTHVANELCQSL